MGKTYSLREIVEFGYVDSMTESKYDRRTNAAKLLWVVFCIGWAILDIRSSQSESSVSQESRSLYNLYKNLVSSVEEMKGIDYFLVRNEWEVVNRHLVIRRLIWEDGTVQKDTQQSLPSIFQPNDTPMYSDFLKDENDEFEVMILLDLARLNHVSSQYVCDGLRQANINFDTIISTVSYLNNLSDKKYPLNKSQLKKIEEFVNKVEIK